MFVGITILFVDFTGLAHTWLGWMAKVQFLPAVLAMSAGVVIGLLVITLVLGRIYCSVICPLGVMQDVFAWMGRRSKKNRYSYSPAKTWLRLGVLAVFVVLTVSGLGGIASVIAPYSAYGRIAQSLLQPLWQWGNNLCAYVSQRAMDYTFYHTDVWMRSLPVLIIAAATLVVLALLAWKGGRTYCNTICPVGTLLGVVSRYSLLRVRIDTHKCNKCGLCARNCKSACIDSKNQKIDYSRCVDCMDCIGKCHKHALSYGITAGSKAGIHSPAGTASTVGPNRPKNSPWAPSRRDFIWTTILLGTAAVKAKAKKIDGGLADIAEKKPYMRQNTVVPPGAVSISNLRTLCTGCQLCVSKCPNGVLRPSTHITHLMQPESSFERGYCRPECTSCSEVCPAGAIKPISREVKSSIQVGHAVWNKDLCVAVSTDDGCGLCSRKCPAGAVEMVFTTIDGKSVIAPAVDEERCIGCGACEYYCPLRPVPAIHVEGHQVHKEV